MTEQSHEALRRELEFFKERLPDLMREHAGKYVLIFEGTIHGVYDSMEEAVAAGLDKLGNVPFLARLVSEHQPSARIATLDLLVDGGT